MIPTSFLEAVSEKWNSAFHIERSAELVAPITRSSLEELPGQHVVYHPYYTLVKNSEQPALKSFTVARFGRTERIVDSAALKRHLQDGFTLKVSGLEFYSEEVFDASKSLSKRTDTLTTAYAFVTPSASQGLAYHRDASHVVVQQVEGVKSWRLWEPDAPAPLAAGIEPNPSGTLHTFELYPGDLLYFPHGWVHAATSGEETSTHITFTLAAPSPNHFRSILDEEGQEVQKTPSQLIQQCMSEFGVQVR